MPSGRNNIDNNFYDRFLITEAMVDDNSQDYDDKMKKYYSKLDKQDSKIDNITAMIKNMMDINHNFNHSPENMDSPKYQGPTNVVPSKNMALPWKGGHSTKKRLHVESQTWDQLTKIL